jgi:phage terminase large subunit-like protein
MMKYASKPNQKIWYVAPTLKMAKDICWSSLKEVLNQFNWIEDINETTLTITIRKTNSTISLKSSDAPDSLRGTGLNFLILDEFSDIDKRTWFEVLRASVSDTLVMFLCVELLKVMVIGLMRCILKVSKTLSGIAFNLLH